MSKFDPKSPYKAIGKDIKTKVDLSNYATKTDLKNVTHVDTLSFALKTNLDNLKTEVDILNIDRLVPVSTDLSKLSNAAKNDVVKNSELIAKVNNIDTSDFVLKANYNANKTELEKKFLM